MTGAYISLVLVLKPGKDTKEECPTQELPESVHACRATPRHLVTK
jgi:hypothetical protein